MSGETQIEWCTKAWNIVSGCSPVSRGCDNCWAARLIGTRLAHLVGNGPLVDIADGAGGTHCYRFSGRVVCHDELLDVPYGWRRPQLVAVSMHGDLLHDAVPKSFLRACWAVMADTRRHVYQVLTKRPERLEVIAKDRMAYHLPEVLPNVWLGTSVEDQQTACQRLRELVDVPAALRFVSYEPALGPLDLNSWLPWLGWVIAGGESGPAARPCDPRWIADIVAQCRAAKVPVFVKQLGSQWARHFGAHSRKGSDPAEWPPALSVRETPPWGDAPLCRRCDDPVVETKL